MSCLSHQCLNLPYGVKCVPYGRLCFWSPQVSHNPIYENVSAHYSRMPVNTHQPSLFISIPMKENLTPIKVTSTAMKAKSIPIKLNSIPIQLIYTLTSNTESLPFKQKKNSKKRHSCCVQSVKQPHSKMARRIQ